MGILYSLYNYFGTPGRTDDPDPVTKLTSRDRYLIQKSWAVVRKDPTGSGVALLNVWLKRHPKYLALFPFRDVPFEDLPANIKYKAHGNNIIYAFSSIIDTLEKTDLLVMILVKVGASHVSRNATEQGFLDLKDAIVELFSTLFTKEEMTAWNKALDVAFDVINNALREEAAKIKVERTA